MFNVIKKEYNKNKINVLFYSIGLLFLLIFISSILITHGEIIRKYLFADIGDTFMDFYNSVFQTVGRRPYSYGNIYPPLCYLFYLFFIRFIPTSQIGESARFLRLTQGGIISGTLFVVIGLLSVCFLSKKLKKGKSAEKVLFSILMLTSIPFIHAFERGNIIIYALIFAMIFFLLKDSKNKILKEISLISLAISFALKIYPAIYGFVLLKEKRYKDIIRLILYAIGIFIIPFLFFGGINSIKEFINNLTSASNDFLTIRFNKLNYMALFSDALLVLKINNGIFLKLIRIAYLFIIGIALISAWITKINWKRIMLLTLLLIGIPSFSFTYVAIFMIIPIMYFLDYNKKRKTIDYVYMALIILIMFANPIALLEHGNNDYFYTHVSLNNKIMSISIFLLTVILCFDIIIEFVKKNYKRIKKTNVSKKKTMNKSRIKYIDAARAIALFLVVLGHLVKFNSPFFNWIFSFHMPLFFILSGFCIDFDKYNSFKQFLLHKVRTLIIPYFSFCVIAIVVSSFIEAWKFGAFSELSVKQIFYYTQPELLHIGQVWFLMALFWSSIMFYMAD